MSADLKWTTNTHVTPFTLTSKIIYMVLEHFFAPSFFTTPPHPHFYPSTMVFTHPNDGWTGLCIKLCLYLPFHVLSPALSNTFSIQHPEYLTPWVSNTFSVQHPWYSTPLVFNTLLSVSHYQSLGTPTDNKQVKRIALNIQYNYSLIVVIPL